MKNFYAFNSDTKTKFLTSFRQKKNKKKNRTFDETLEDNGQIFIDFQRISAVAQQNTLCYAFSVTSNSVEKELSVAINYNNMTDQQVNVQ